MDHVFEDSNPIHKGETFNKLQSTILGDTASVIKVQAMKGPLMNIQSLAIIETSTGKHEKEQHGDGQGYALLLLTLNIMDTQSSELKFP